MLSYLEDDERLAGAQKIRFHQKRGEIECLVVGLLTHSQTKQSGLWRITAVSTEKLEHKPTRPSAPVKTFIPRESDN